MLTTTQDNFSEYVIVATLGLVRGNTIRARHVGKDILAGLRTLVGGEITEYTKMLAESREQAIDRMITEARAKGADGIVCVRFTTSAVMQGAAELLAYGTAVKLKKKKPATAAPLGQKKKPSPPAPKPAPAGMIQAVLGLDLMQLSCI